MGKEKHKLTWVFIVLLLGLGFMNTREFHKMRANFSSIIYPVLLSTQVSKVQVDEVGRKTSQFDNAQLQLIFESLVKSYNSNFNERSAKIDFTAIYISEADLKTLGNIVTDQQREENERNVALYILSQIGESALSTLTFIALSDISCCDTNNSKFELALQIKAFEAADKLSYQFAHYGQVLESIQNLQLVKKDPNLDFMLQTVLSNLMARTPQLKNSFSEKLL